MILKLFPLYAWLLAFYGISQTDPSCEDFNQLKEYPIIGFGEACHGSYSDYEARAQLIHCLTANGDSIAVAIEMPHFTGIAIQKYYAGEIDKDSLLTEARYYGLQTDAFIDFVDQFKGNERVSFYGIDMQMHQSTLMYIKETMQEYASPLSDKLVAAFDSLNYNFLRNFTDSAYLEYQPVVNRNLAYLIQTIAADDPLNDRSFPKIQYPLIILQQHLQMIDYLKHGNWPAYNLHRDSCMANNVRALQAYSKKQMLVFAANGHLMTFTDKKYTMMGGHLKNYYHDDYFVIVSQYYQGNLLEVQVIDGQRTRVQKELLPPYKKSLAFKIDAALHPAKNTLLMLSNLDEKSLQIFKRKCLAQDMGIGRGDHKTAGLVYFRPGTYDAIYFIPMVKASTNIAP